MGRLNMEKLVNLWIRHNTPRNAKVVTLLLVLVALAAAAGAPGAGSGAPGGGGIIINGLPTF
jgi:hypothetical protein